MKSHRKYGQIKGERYPRHCKRNMFLDGAIMKNRRIVSTILILTTAIAALGLTVNPWPRDRWYQTGSLLVGTFPGEDDYTPVAAPAVLFHVAHQTAEAIGVDLAGEFYIASVLQNLLILASAYFVFYASIFLQLERMSGFVAVGFLLLVLSTGLPQAFWSESVVLFLMSAVVLVLTRMLRDTGDSNLKFRLFGSLCGFLVSALVVTRMTPVFLIPGLCLLFFNRLSISKLAQLMGIVCVITAAVVVGMVVSNHVRFGRYELTNSSGRHLWQGVREFSDSALAHSADYRSLKAMDPEIQGKNWWEIRFPEQSANDDPAVREALLGKLAVEAIVAAPVGYLANGLRKFIRTIGVVPYRLGFGGRGTYWNPLDRSEFLPSIADAVHLPGRLSAAARRLFRDIHRVFEWLYPITIFLIATAYLAVLLGGARRLLRDAMRNSRLPGQTVPVGLFLALSVPLAMIPVASLGYTWKAFFSSCFCTIAAFGFASILSKSFRKEVEDRSSLPECPMFTFSFSIFFGSLWFSWQIESANSRNTIVYLPFWCLMLGSAVEYWKNTWYSIRAR